MPMIGRPACRPIMVCVAERIDGTLAVGTSGKYCRSRTWPLRSIRSASPLLWRTLTPIENAPSGRYANSVAVAPLPAPLRRCDVTRPSSPRRRSIWVIPGPVSPECWPSSMRVNGPCRRIASRMTRIFLSAISPDRKPIVFPRETADSSGWRRRGPERRYRITVFPKHLNACVSQGKLSQLISCALDAKTKLLNLSAATRLGWRRRDADASGPIARPRVLPAHRCFFSDRTRHVSHDCPTP
jgi:hypothetical protein